MRMTSKTKRTCTGGRHTALDIFCFAVFFLKQNKSRNICNLVGVSWVSGEVSEGCLRGVWKLLVVYWFPVVYKKKFLEGIKRV